MDFQQYTTKELQHDNVTEDNLNFYLNINQIYVNFVIIYNNFTINKYKVAIYKLT